jgi:regulator of sigma E protease
MNFLIAFLLIAGIYAIRGTDQGTQQVGKIDSKSPAAHVLRPGDRLVAVDGHRGGPETFRRAIGAHKCAGTPTDGCLATTPARLTIVRAGATRTVTVRPRYYAAEKATRVGFAYRFRTLHYSLPAAARESVSTMWTVTSKTVTAVVRIFFSSKERKQVSGVVGSYETTRQSFQLSTAQALFVLAIISLSLAVVNLFPFLPLDGGHIFWALAEKVRGRSIPFSVMERASVVGIVLVLFIFVVGLSNDINRLTGEGFGVR